MFGIGAYAGRTLTPADDQAGAPPVAVMGHRVWQDRYGSDPSVIGSTFNVNERPFTVVGITPPSFFGDTLRGSPPDLFLPLNAEPYIESEDDLNKYGQHWLQMIGRIEPRGQPTAIQAQMQVELKQWLRSHWGEIERGRPREFRSRRYSRSRAALASPAGANDTSVRSRS